jgi:hypothetical protein
MSEILFVHGTGVRRVAFDRTLRHLRRQSQRYLNGANVHGCLWGEPEGAKLRLDGASIPNYDDQPARSISAAEAEEIELVTWRMLGEDPLFELRLLENLTAPRRELVPREKAPGRISLDFLTKLQPPPNTITFLQQRKIYKFWRPGLQNLIAQPELEAILIKANRDPREVSRALARALVASINRAATEAGSGPLSGATRQQLADLLIPVLGGQALAPFDWITKPLAGLAKRMGTFKARRKRRVLSDSSYPVAGDILLYQARGGSIRRFIDNELGKIQGSVVIFAHSLGGIATVDLLVSRDLQTKVSGLVTIGSQAPLLYEIGALKSLPFGRLLPAHFPKKWLNIFDPNDFLSYAGELVFGKSAVKDVMVVSKLPFPDAHSAYWDHEDTWRAIKGFFPWT